MCQQPAVPRPNTNRLSSGLCTHPLFYVLVVFLKKSGRKSKRTLLSEIRGLALTERSQPNGDKPKIRDGKLGSGVNWQRALKKEDVKQTGVKRGLGSRFLQFPQTNDEIGDDRLLSVVTQRFRTVLPHFTMCNLCRQNTVNK